MNCSIFVPSHITGFFEIMDNPDPIKKGSRGAGVVMDKGVITETKISDGNGIKIRVNGQNDPRNATITKKTIEIIKRNFHLDDKKVTIDHDVQVPIGAGFGTSAAFALGTALGISTILKLPLTFKGAAQIAHIAEVEMKSGLGDVIGELSGGMVLRLKEGAPGIGITDKLLLDQGEDIYVISKCLGEINTADIIEDPVHKDRINSIGRDLLLKFIQDPKPEKLMDLSIKFAQKTGLMSNEISEIIKVLEDETIGASMAMLGNTAFAISKTQDTSIENAIVAKINHNGLRFL
ncbi:MAG: pantoate kinase [Methanobacterium sp.]